MSGLITTVSGQVDFAGKGELSSTKSHEVPGAVTEAIAFINGFEMREGVPDEPIGDVFHGYKCFVSKVSLTGPSTGKTVEVTFTAHMASRSMEDNWFGGIQYTILCFG